MRSLRAAVAFLTPLPVGVAVPTAAALAWFPLVGSLLGGAVGLVWWGADEVFPPAVAAAVALAAGVVATGALHLDGLADSADGLLPHLDGPDHRKAVMAAPDVGAFGVVAVVAALLLQWTALASLAPEPMLVAVIWGCSRGAMAVALRTVSYVGGGLGSAFVGEGGLAVAVLLLVVTGALGAITLASPGTGAIAIAAGAAAAAGVVALGRRRLGGVTGDVLGAAGVLFETAALVVATARI